MSIRLVASVLTFIGYASAAYANSCSNIDVIGSFDETGLHESEFGISATGSFRVAGEADESKQPNFNLTMVNCEKTRDDNGKVSLGCKVTRAVVWATSDKPNTDNPNCELDLDIAEYSMKELQRGVLTGMEPFPSTSCYETMLTIDRNAQRVYLSFTRTKSADVYDKTRPGTCGAAPRTQVLMNCTAYPRMRHQGQTLPRYCDFSSSSSK